jgi:hypothetical protein
MFWMCRNRTTARRVRTGSTALRCCCWDQTRTRSATVVGCAMYKVPFQFVPANLSGVNRDQASDRTPGGPAVAASATWPTLPRVTGATFRSDGMRHTLPRRCPGRMHPHVEYQGLQCFRHGVLRQPHRCTLGIAADTRANPVATLVCASSTPKVRCSGIACIRRT